MINVWHAYKYCSLSDLAALTSTILFPNLYPLPSFAASAPVSSSVSRHRAPSSVTPLSWEKHNIVTMSNITIDPELKPGEFVIKSLFAEFAVLAEKKIEMVMAEPLVSPEGVSSNTGNDTYCWNYLSCFATAMYETISGKLVIINYVLLLSSVPFLYIGAPVKIQILCLSLQLNVIISVLFLYLAKVWNN